MADRRPQVDRGEGWGEESGDLQRPWYWARYTAGIHDKELQAEVQTRQHVNRAVMDHPMPMESDRPQHQGKQYQLGKQPVVFS